METGRLQSSYGAAQSAYVALRIQRPGDPIYLERMGIPVPVRSVDAKQHDATADVQGGGQDGP